MRPVLLPRVPSTVIVSIHTDPLIQGQLLFKGYARTLFRDMIYMH